MSEPVKEEEENPENENADNQEAEVCITQPILINGVCLKTSNIRNFSVNFYEFAVALV